MLAMSALLICKDVGHAGTRPAAEIMKRNGPRRARIWKGGVNRHGLSSVDSGAHSDRPAPLARRVNRRTWAGLR